MHRFELGHIRIDTAFARLVHLRRCFLTGQLDVAFDSGPLQRLDIQDELEYFPHGGCRIEHDVLIADNMYRYFRLEPKVVEVLPHGNLLLDEFGPLVRELVEVEVSDGEVVRARADHVKEGGDAVERATH